jgi:hypothetical protein
MCCEIGFLSFLTTSKAKAVQTSWKLIPLFEMQEEAR